ncbi:Isochorismatase-like protein [Entophlyctis helioformis]|nr:Isochorismatase-like protein [Entophlyctis helioformis]
MSALVRPASLRSPSLASTAFFVCDIQERFRPLIHNFPSVVATAHKMIEAAKILSVPLIVTEQHPKGLGHTVAELDVAGAHCRLPKTKFSMWTPEVESIVTKELKSKSAVLFGIESHVCVTQTALDLLRNDIDVYVLADGVSSMNKEEVPIAIQRLKEAGAVITSSESILFQLLVDSNHTHFKAISNLVKTTKDSTASALKGLTSSL